MANDTMSSTRCTNCNKLAHLSFQIQDLNRHISDTYFSYFHCDNCGQIFMSPIPENLSDYYTSNYYSVPATLAELANLTGKENYKLETIRRFTSGGKLLEIGPSVGAFAYLTKMAGFSTEVIEMDRDCCTFIENVLQIKAINSADVAEALKTVGEYNVITMWQVIEHLPNPWLTLAELARHLLPGGILVIAAPNPDSLQFHVVNRYWAHIDAPRHLQLIPISLLKTGMAKHGLQLAFETTSDEGAIACNLFGWRSSLNNSVDNPSLKKIMRGVGIVANSVLEPIERSGLRGSSYTLVFQKPS